MEQKQISFKERLKNWLLKARGILVSIWLIGSFACVALVSNAKASAADIAFSRDWLLGGVVMLVAFFMIVSVVTTPVPHK